MSKKWLSTLLGGLVMASLSSPSGAAELSGKITIWSWDVAAKSLSDSAANFKKLHPKVEFVIEDLGTDQVYDKLTTCLAANVGLPDVVSIEGERISGFASKFPQSFVDFTGKLKTDDFLKVKRAECTVNGRLVAVPWDSGPCALYYRTDYFQKAGVKPGDLKTWEDLLKAGKKMNALGVKMLPTSVSRRITLYSFMLNQQGQALFNQNGKPQFDSEASVKAMTMVKKLYDAGVIYDSVNWDGLVTATKDGKVATVASAVWWAGTMKDEIKDASGKWAVMRMPSLSAGGGTAATDGGSDLMVLASSPSRQAAVEFAKFAMTDKASLVNGFSKYGLYPSYIPSFKDPVFEMAEPYFGNQKIWKLFAQIAPEIPPVHSSEYYQEVCDLAYNAQARILLKNADVRSTLKSLQQDAMAKISQ